MENKKKFNDTNDVIIGIIGALLFARIFKDEIEGFIDKSLDATLKDNEVILETSSKKFKIRVDEIE
ncbi:MAG: hypothetical protein ACOCRX_00945 [Candidatus Woesearchaeota archaeon]